MSVFDRLFRRADRKIPHASGAGDIEIGFSRVLERSQKVRTHMTKDIEKFIKVKSCDAREADNFRSTYLESLGVVVEEPCRQSPAVLNWLVDNRNVFASAQEAIERIDAFWSRVNLCLDGKTKAGGSSLETDHPFQPGAKQHPADLRQEDALAILTYLRLRSTMHILRLKVRLWDKGILAMRLQKGLPPFQREHLMYLATPAYLVAESAKNPFAFERLMLLGLLEDFRGHKCVAEAEELTEEVGRLLETIMSSNAPMGVDPAIWS